MPWTLRLTDIEAGPARAPHTRAQPHLYLVLEGDAPLAGSARHCLAGIDEVQIGRGDIRGLVRGQGKLEITVPDRWMSHSHARLLRGADGWEVQDAGSKNGTFVNGAQTKRARLEDGDLIEIGHAFFLWRPSVAIAAGAPLDVHAGRAQLDGDIPEELAAEDLGLIIGELLRKVAGARAGELVFAALAARSVLLHAWRRGVGELEACLDAAVALAGAGHEIEREHLPIARAHAEPPPLQEAPTHEDSPTDVDPAVDEDAPTGEEPTQEAAPLDMPSEKQRLTDALVAAEGNQTQAAKQLGMSRTTLRKRMKALDIVVAKKKKS